MFGRLVDNVKNFLKIINIHSSQAKFWGGFIMAKNTTPLECLEQEKIFRWSRANQIRYPSLQWLHGSLNGVRLTPGLRNKMKKQGMTKGYPDIDLPIRVNDYNGLHIEFKRLRGGVVSYEQKEWLKHLNKEGRLAVIAKGHDKAISIIKKYLEI